MGVPFLLISYKYFVFCNMPLSYKLYKLYKLPPCNEVPLLLKIAEWAQECADLPYTEKKVCVPTFVMKFIKHKLNDKSKSVKRQYCLLLNAYNYCSSPEPLKTMTHCWETPPKRPQRWKLWSRKGMALLISVEQLFGNPKEYYWDKSDDKSSVIIPIKSTVEKRALNKNFSHQFYS